jgi:hypothetical protein
MLRLGPLTYHVTKEQVVLSIRLPSIDHFLFDDRVAEALC